MKILLWMLMCTTLQIVAQNMYSNETEIHVRILETAVMNCRLSSNVINYKWQKNENNKKLSIAQHTQLSSSFNNSRFHITEDKGVYSLIILNVTNTDSGQYTCDQQIKNSNDISTSNYTLKLTECTRGRFGQKCQFKCNCLNGYDCNPVHGSCPHGHCAAGWQLNNCSKECNHGSFGQNCQFKCNCLNGAGCYHDDGRCPHGNCAAGWQLNNCSKECAHGRFGQNCQFKCNCLNGTGCNPINGSCPHEHCGDGRELNNCSVVSQQECLTGVSFEVFSICISAVIILAALTVMTVCCYFRRKISQSSRLYEDIRVNAGQRTNEDPVYSELEGQASC